MEVGLLLKENFLTKLLDKIACIIDIIPKAIYFLSAVFFSAIDVLQCLVRKLAGLDVYYVQQAGSTDLSAVAQTDPLSEFVMGILGMGDSAPLYRGLNTVFWSLTVFAILCLAVTTMIAIIKSHYNEDAGATSPWKYVYTAIKAALTFAIVPFAVIIGMELASWTLQTVDSITAGSATEEAIVSTYGSQAKEAFKSEALEGSKTGTEYYSHYDMFGAGRATSSTPFSGMIFKACTYDANRARSGAGGASGTLPFGFANIRTNGGVVIFEKGADDPAELADMIDYAFANNLRLTEEHYISKTQIVLNSNARTWEAMEILNPLTNNVKGFSKWNVGLVWQFYNLWSYNFIVAFGGGITIMGIMLSVIIGLMSRLMKGAVLFLIYPSLLGIAPLDNFKAFKSWTNQFMQQVMMAFGAIIGMNLTLLMLPYVQNIKFFNIAVIDYIVNIVIVMTALMMMKDIIGMISNFVGGADANNVGSGLKGEVGKGIATGAKITGKAGLAVTRGVVGVANKAVKAGRGVVRAARTHGPLKNTGIGANAAMKKANDAVSQQKAKKSAAEEKVDTILANSGVAGLQSRESDLMESEAYQKASAKDQQEMLRKTRRNYFEQHQDEFDPADIKDIATAQKEVHNADVDLEKAQAKQKRVAKAFHFREHKDADGNVTYDENDRIGIAERTGDAVKGTAKSILFGKVKEGYKEEKDDSGKIVYKDADGDIVSRADARAGGIASKSTWSALNMKFTDMVDQASIVQAGKHMADGFLKGMADLGGAAGLDKMMKGMGDIFEGGWTFKGGVFDIKDKKPEGDKLAEAQHAENKELAKQRHKEQLDSNKEIIKTLEKVSNAMAGVSTNVNALKGSFTKLSEDIKGVTRRGGGRGR